MTQQILFDLDDTLIYCNRYFFRAIHECTSLIQDWINHPVVTYEKIKTMHSFIDTKLISETGFKSDHFPQSFVDTYLHFSQLVERKPVKNEVEQLWDKGRAVYFHQTEPYPHMQETLQHLQDEGHELHLYTGGEPDIQWRKINDMGLESFFNTRIHIRQKKNTAALEQLLTDLKLPRSQTWMIGNSIRNDIVPALSSGIHAIHVEVPEEWAYNIVSVNVTPKGEFITVKGLHEIPAIIARS